eukprot:3144-Eustigmatos_ZCMA.PRE.1
MATFVRSLHGGVFTPRQHGAPGRSLATLCLYSCDPLMFDYGLSTNAGGAPRGKAGHASRHSGEGGVR